MDPDPNSSSPDSDMPEVKRTSGDGQWRRRFDELRDSLQRLEAEVLEAFARTSPPHASGRRKSSPPASSRAVERAGQLERELKRVKQELAQRRVELTEVRMEAARAQQRAEQEGERLRAELAAAQRILAEALSPDLRDSGFAPRGEAGVSEAPARSGPSRRNAETLRPVARPKR